MIESACPWIVWTYSLQGDWSAGLPWPTRDEAREVRAEAIENDGLPPSFVAVRHESAGPPKQRPPWSVIDRERAALAAGADR